MDMSTIQIFSRVACSACGVEFIARCHIDRFQILESIAEGGTSSVFKARDSGSGILVALKIIAQDPGADSAVLDQREAHALAIAGIHHTNIVRIFHVGKTSEYFYLAMELLGGETMDDWIASKGRLEEATVLKIGIEAAEGLSALLVQGLLHRDVKPANIMFTESRSVKLVDFGLSSPALGEIWGTPNYIAPEKLTEKPDDFRSDIFSLGATLFHALAGRAPCETEHIPLEALRELKKHPVDLRSLVPEFHEGTVQVIGRMMALEPTERPAGYRELIEQLHEVLGQVQVRAH
jgi:serine/threonine protein kinase